MTITLYPYQQEDAEKFVEQGLWKALLAYDTGLGKTFTSIAMAEEAFKAGVLTRLLVLAPLSVIEHWKREWYVFNDARVVDVVPSTLSVADRLSYMKQSNAEVIVTNIDTIGRASAKQVRWVRKVFDGLIVDEADVLRNWRNLTWRRVKSLTKYHRFIVLSTATPIDKMVSEVWGLLSVLLPTIYENSSGSISYWKFRNIFEVWEDHIFKHMRKTIGGLPWDVVFHKHMEQTGVWYRRKKKDVQQWLPELHTHVVRIEATPWAKKVYTDLVSEFYYIDDDVYITASSQLGVMQKLRQIEDTFDLDDKHPKIEWIVNALSDGRLTTPVVVFTPFRATQSLLTDYLEDCGWKVACINGDVPQEERQQIIDNFQSRKLHVVVCTFGAGGVGIQFTAAQHVVMTSLDWSYRMYYQALSRVHRNGQDRDVHVWVLVSHPVGDYILRLVRKKEKVNIKALKTHLWNKEKKGEHYDEDSTVSEIEEGLFG